jgi:hypothetical protein
VEATPSPSIQVQHLIYTITARIVKEMKAQGKKLEAALKKVLYGLCTNQKPGPLRLNQFQAGPPRCDQFPETENWFYHMAYGEDQSEVAATLDKPVLGRVG